MTEGFQLICLHTAVGDICNITATSAISELDFCGGKFSNHSSYIRFCKMNSYPGSCAGLGWGRVNFHHKDRALSLSQSKSAQVKSLKEI